MTATVAQFPTRNNRTVGTRRAFQTQRPGWRPASRSQRQRARYVAESIQAHGLALDAATWERYGLQGHIDQQAEVRNQLQMLMLAAELAGGR